MGPIDLGSVILGGGAPLALIAGPCVIEGREAVLREAEVLADLARSRNLPLVFKASFDKANRTSGGSFRGPGLEEGLAILAAVRDATGLPVTTDVHLPDQAAPVAEVVDLLQVPAFLCRQTDLIEACAATGRPVNLKKGQFVAAEDMVHAVAKATAAGAPGVAVTERGTCFGHHDLVVDLRGLVRLTEAGVPTIFDATHAVQRPGGAQTGGDRRFVAPLARAAVGVGVDAVFLEVHPDPDRARSDAASQLPLEELPGLVDALLRLAEARGRGTR